MQYRGSGGRGKANDNRFCSRRVVCPAVQVSFGQVLVRHSVLVLVALITESRGVRSEGVEPTECGGNFNRATPGSEDNGPWREKGVFGFGGGVPTAMESRGGIAEVISAIFWFKDNRSEWLWGRLEPDVLAL